MEDRHREDVELGLTKAGGKPDHHRQIGRHQVEAWAVAVSPISDHHPPDDRSDQRNQKAAGQWHHPSRQGCVPGHEVQTAEVASFAEAPSSAPAVDPDGQEAVANQVALAARERIAIEAGVNHHDAKGLLGVMPTRHEKPDVDQKSQDCRGLGSLVDRAEHQLEGPADEPQHHQRRRQRLEPVATHEGRSPKVSEVVTGQQMRVVHHELQQGESGQDEAEAPADLLMLKARAHHHKHPQHETGPAQEPEVEGARDQRASWRAGRG